MDSVPELNRRVWGLFLDRQNFQHLLNHITQRLPLRLRAGRACIHKTGHWPRARLGLFSESVTNAHFSFWKRKTPYKTSPTHSPLFSPKKGGSACVCVCTHVYMCVPPVTEES